MSDMLDCTIKLFADDTKLSAKITSDEERSKLQENINKMCDWTSTWLMSLNTDKCKFLEIGNNLGNHNYTLTTQGNTTTISRVTMEKDLGVTIDNQLKFTAQCNAAALKANRMLGIVFRTFTYMSPTMFITLYKTLIRPHLEYATTIWSPMLTRDKITLENVQRRATKRIPSIQNLSYSERIKKLGLPSLEYRRNRADVIQVYKILNKIDILDQTTMFRELTGTATRGHSKKLFKKRLWLNSTGNFFINRVIKTWNSLSVEVVTSPTLNCFKSRLNKLWVNHPCR
ncbi:uncharacterized protein [Argopecten irradians]|uniref:uncharacterized protein n=1 Tax=Argopecten irradians TaxID=31199 RepID=UPI0037158E1A